MTPEEWEHQVGRHVRKRREDLGRGVRSIARLADISEAQWRQIESGRRSRGGIVDVVNPRADTKSAVCRALGWSVDSIDRLIAGDQPELMQRVDIVEEVAQLRAEVGRLDAELARLAGRSPSALPG